MSFSVEKALKHRVVLLSGDEEGLRRRGLSDLLEGCGVAADDFDLTMTDGSTDPLEWFAGSATIPFMADRRVVVVRQLLRCDPNIVFKSSGKKGEDRLVKELESLPPTALLILVADEEAGDDSKQDRLKTVRKRWEKAVSDSKGIIETFATDAKQMPALVRKEAERIGKSLSPRAAEILAEMVGGSLTRAFEEIEKLALYSTDASISESDVRAIVLPAREWNVFNLTSAIVRGDASDALRHLRILVGSSTKAEEAAFRSIFPILSRQIRLLWQARVCLDAKVSLDNLPEHIARSFPEKPNLAKESPYRRGAIVSSARSVTFDGLQRCFELLSDADARIKGMLPAFGTMETLEQMVLEMIEVLSKKPVRA